MITDGTVTLGAGDARAMLGRLEPGTARLVVTSPPYLDALDYAAYRAGERQSWYSGARVPMADYLAEHRAVVAALARACADDAIVALEVDDVRDRDTRTLTPLPELWRDLLASAGFRLVERIRLVRPVAVGRRSGQFIKSGGRVGTYYPDAVASDLLIAMRGDPQARLRRDGKGSVPLDIATLRPFLVNAWRLTPPQRSRAVAHPCPMSPEVVGRLIDLYSLPGDLVVDPYAGAGTTGWEAARRGRHAVLCEREPQFVDLIRSLGSVRSLDEESPDAARRIQVPSAQLWLPLSAPIEAATSAAYAAIAKGRATTARHRSMAARLSQLLGVAVPPELMALSLATERQYVASTRRTAVSV